MNEPQMTKEQLDEWLKGNCNRYANGQCSTRACLVRGGYKAGPADYDIATCDAHEIGTLAGEGLRLREAGEQYDACLAIRDKQIADLTAELEALRKESV